MTPGEIVADCLVFSDDPSTISERMGPAGFVMSSAPWTRDRWPEPSPTVTVATLSLMSDVTTEPTAPWFGVPRTSILALPGLTVNPVNSSEVNSTSIGATPLTRSESMITGGGGGAGGAFTILR